MQVRKQQLELDMEQQTGSKEEKEYVKAVYCHPAYLTYMQNTSCEMLGCMKRKLKSNFGSDINNDRYADDTTLMAKRWGNNGNSDRLYFGELQNHCRW